MDSFSPEGSRNTLSDGMIREITSENNTTFVTVAYTDCVNCRRRNQTIVLVVGRQTRILNENGNTVRASELRVGMTINATFSSAMTRSIPPQASAFTIRITKRPASDHTAVGRIIDIDRQNRSFTTINDQNPSSIIRFQVPADALILDRFGRPIHFSRLVPGLRVRIHHAPFMTASIPPQTTAFEIQVMQ